MEGKLVLSFVLLTVLIEAARATCPSRRFRLAGGCWQNWRSRCRRDYHCPDGKECCAVQQCWGMRYCRRSINPIQVQVNTNKKVNTVSSSNTPIVKTPVQQQSVPTVTEPVQQQAVLTVNTQAQQQAVEIRGGQCGRKIECSGMSCSQDGDCPFANKCCLDRCGVRTCSRILRSSVFIHRGKK